MVHLLDFVGCRLFILQLVYRIECAMRSLFVLFKIGESHAYTFEIHIFDTCSRCFDRLFLRLLALRSLRVWGRRYLSGSNRSIAAAILPRTCTLSNRFKLGNNFLKQGF